MCDRENIAPMRVGGGGMRFLHQKIETRGFQRTGIVLGAWQMLLMETAILYGPNSIRTLFPGACSWRYTWSTLAAGGVSLPFPKGRCCLEDEESWNAS